MKDTSILTNNGINVQTSLDLLGDMEMYDETLGEFLDMTDDKISALETQRRNILMAIDKGIAASILSATTRSIGDKAYGNMLLGIPNDDAVYQAAVEYLKAVPDIVIQEVE